MRKSFAFVAVALACGRAAAAGDPVFSEGWRFTERDGAVIYRTLCQACHMEDGRGATGAGSYPALAANPRLAVPAYPVLTLLQGRKAMPALGRQLDDEQVAAVASYVRTNFGNRYPEPIRAADVKALR